MLPWMVWGRLLVDCVFPQLLWSRELCCRRAPLARKRGLTTGAQCDIVVLLLTCMVTSGVSVPVSPPAVVPILLGQGVCHCQFGWRGVGCESRSCPGSSFNGGVYQTCYLVQHANKDRIVSGPMHWGQCYRIRFGPMHLGQCYRI